MQAAATCSPESTEEDKRYNNKTLFIFTSSYFHASASATGHYVA